MACLLLIFTLLVIEGVFGIKVVEPSFRVAGSEIAEKHSIPYQADVIIDFHNSETLYRTGTLISRNYVLTAANCVVNSSKITVVMGVYNVEDKNEATRRTYLGDSYIAHSHYDKNTGTNDIAVIHLNQSSEINDYIQLAILPRFNYIFTKPLYGKEARVSGWGNVEAGSDLEHSILRYANITIQRYHHCLSHFPHADFKQLCSTHPTRFFEISDIGAPLVLGKVQVGIAVATNIVNEKEQSPQLYTRLDLYLLWLAIHTDAKIEW